MEFSSLFCQAGLFPCWSKFQHVVTAWSCTSRISFLKNVQCSWAHLQTTTASQEIFSTRLLNRPKSALHKFKVHVLLAHLPYFSENEKPCHFVITVAQGAFNHHIPSPTSPSLFTNNSSSRVPYLVDILISCVRALSSRVHIPGTSWTGSSPLCCFSSRHLVGWNPPQEQWQWLWEFSQLFLHYFACLFFLFWWPIADIDHGICLSNKNLKSEKKEENLQKQESISSDFVITNTSVSESNLSDIFDKFFAIICLHVNWTLFFK